MCASPGRDVAHCRVLKTRGLTQAQAAKVLKMSQPRVSALVRGRLELFSIDALVEMLALASPLTTATAVDAPAWMVELTSKGAHTVTALIYGDEVGLQLVRVPAASDGQSAARLIPARLAKGELHIIALDLSTLRAQAHAPKGAPPMSWTASGRFITAFQSKTGTGVRVGW